MYSTMVTLGERLAEGVGDTTLAVAEAVRVAEAAMGVGDALASEVREGVREGDEPGDRGRASQVVKSQLDRGLSTGQGAHWADPDKDAKVPMGQSEQKEDWVSLYWPGEQSRHVARPA
jgi:hypothetical protein